MEMIIILVLVIFRDIRPGKLFFNIEHNTTTYSQVDSAGDYPGTGDNNVADITN